MPEKSKINGLEIAIIGMSGRFPGARNIAEFWENLKNGVNSITYFTEEELLHTSSLDAHVIKEPNFVKARGILEHMEYFDAFFFCYSPLEAEILDPQVRIFHEICWEALEDAACDPSTYPGLIGLYAGAAANRWWEMLTIMSGKNEEVGVYLSDYLIDKDILSSRISYKLDLKGPSITLHTTCSTGLVAVDLACRALLTGQCDAALAGAVCLLPQAAKAGGYMYEAGLIRSPDGYVRTFDAKAQGTVFSDGAGVVLMKRLADASADGDDIYAVIKGFCTNNDGINKSSFTAPSVDGQAEVIRSAQYMSEVEAESITYLECHGTGTEIGDPIEVEALKTAFNTAKKHYCAVGSVKTNIGHLDTAAGIAGFIKTVLAIKHRQIPPTLNFEIPNPKIDFENSPFYVNTELLDWKTNGHPLRAGVSSFGVGGTNAHVILEEPPWICQNRLVSKPIRDYQLIILSARTEAALKQVARNLVSYFKENPETNLADAAYTLTVGRKAFEHRKMLICQNIHEALDIMDDENRESANKTRHIHTYVAGEEKRAVFMFPGQGSQYVDMARGLYETEAVFREVMDQCFNILAPIMGCDLKDTLYHYRSEPAEEAAHQVLTTDQARGDIDQTKTAQPVIFAVEYALAKLLMAWGIQPYAMIGHSIGEYTAACLAGVFTLKDALTLVAWRGKLILIRDVGALYENGGGNLPELWFQYVEYWLDQFKGEIPRLDIFTDFPRPPIQSFSGVRINFEFDEEVTQELNRLK